MKKKYWGVMLLPVMIVLLISAFVYAEELSAGEELSSGEYSYEGYAEDVSELVWDGSEEEDNEAVDPEAEDSLTEEPDLVGAASGKCGDNLTWTLSDDGVFTINGTGEMYDYKIVNLDETIRVDECELSMPWNDSRQKIKKVVLSEGVTSVGKYSFYFCTKLETVVLPNSLYLIDDYAFYTYETYCLDNVVIPDHVKIIGKSAFSGGRLTELTIPGNVESIGESAFAQCGIKKLTIQEGVKKIGRYAFWRNAVTSVTIPSSVTLIERSCFAECESLTSISLPDTLIAITDHAFAFCTNLSSITIPPNVRHIGRNAFSDMRSLKEVWFTGNAPYLGDRIFLEDFVDVYYPDNLSWSSASLHNYGGHVTWIPMSKTAITGCFNSVNGGDVRWERKKGASAYVLYRKRAADGVKKVAVIHDPAVIQYIDNGIKDNCWGRVYVYYVVTLYGSKQQSGPKSDEVTLQRLAPMRITDLKSTAKKTVSISYVCTVNQNKALGYEIQYAQTQNDLFQQRGTFQKVSVDGRKNLTATIKNLAANKRYYFRVRCYVNYEHSVTHQKTKTWSQYSNVMSVVTL